MKKAIETQTLEFNSRYTDGSPNHFHEALINGLGRKMLPEAEIKFVVKLWEIDNNKKLPFKQQLIVDQSKILNLKNPNCKSLNLRAFFAPHCVLPYPCSVYAKIPLENKQGDLFLANTKLNFYQSELLALMEGMENSQKLHQEIPADFKGFVLCFSANVLTFWQEKLLPKIDLKKYLTENNLL